MSLKVAIPHSGGSEGRQRSLLRFQSMLGCDVTSRAKRCDLMPRFYGDMTSGKRRIGDKKNELFDFRTCILLHG